jgi:hypothetical protein
MELTSLRTTLFHIASVSIVASRRDASKNAPLSFLPYADYINDNVSTATMKKKERQTY